MKRREIFLLKHSRERRKRIYDGTIRANETSIANYLLNILLVNVIRMFNVGFTM